MNVQSAEKQINKLLEYVREIHSENPTMYEKSKRRLNNIALTCNQIVSLISEILESEILSNDTTNEFCGIEQNVLFSVLSMEESLSQLKRFVTNNVNEFITTNNHRTVEMINNYLSVFSTFSEKYENLPEGDVKTLIYLIYTWLSMRFKFYGRGFKFCYEEVGKWICDIIIVYGYHVDNHTSEGFTSRFLQWCYGLSVPCEYGVPHEIYSLGRNQDLYSNYLTLTSLMLCDSLLSYDTASVDMSHMIGLYRDYGMVSLKKYQEYHHSQLNGGDVCD